jgi:4'-phosphopantetheinyl transferase
MDSGHYMMLDLEEGYSGAIWSADPMEIRYEYADITLD